MFQIFRHAVSASLQTKVLERSALLAVENLAPIPGRGILNSGLTRPSIIVAAPSFIHSGRWPLVTVSSGTKILRISKCALVNTIQQNLKVTQFIVLQNRIYIGSKKCTVLAFRIPSVAFRVFDLAIADLAWYPSSFFVFYWHWLILAS